MKIKIEDFKEIMSCGGLFRVMSPVLLSLHLLPSIIRGLLVEKLQRPGVSNKNNRKLSYSLSTYSLLACP